MQSFNELIEGQTPVLVDFTATWCGPCKMLAPILHELANKMGDTVKIIKIDVDKNPQASQSYNIMAVPTLILFKAGKQVWRQSGVVSANELERVITPYVA